MRLRTVLLAVSALGLVASSGTADATVRRKPVCHLITDNRGDGANRVTGFPNSPSLDIVGGDIATGKRTVVGVLRLDKYDVANDPQAFLGFEWNIRFTIKGTTYAFTYADGRGTYGKSAGFMIDSANVATPTVKVANNAISWSVPRKVVPGLKKSGQTLVTLAATSGYDHTSADAASTTKTYPDLYPSCLAPA